MVSVKVFFVRLCSGFDVRSGNSPVSLVDVNLCKGLTARVATFRTMYLLATAFEFTFLGIVPRLGIAVVPVKPRGYSSHSVGTSRSSHHISLILSLIFISQVLSILLMSSSLLAPSDDMHTRIFHCYSLLLTQCVLSLSYSRSVGR